VGLSRIRETAVFGGLPIAERHHDLRCGVAVIDLVSGRVVAKFEFLSGVEEIFGVDVITSHTHPVLSGASVDGNEREIWVVPPEASHPGQLPSSPSSNFHRGDPSNGKA
jgi:hypothetical protein